MKPSLKALLETSHLYGGNATFIEELYDQYLENPNSVAEPWRDFFDRMQQEGLRDRSGARTAGAASWSRPLAGWTRVRPRSRPRCCA
jgi:2-oxoglutarate dehydrogenase complex dehydrogenase (E1) component-like enzyme